MKYYLLFFSFLAYFSINAQCDLNGSNWLSANAPENGCVWVNSTTCAYFNEYSTFNNLDASQTYRVRATFNGGTPPYTFNVYDNNAQNSTPIAFSTGSESPLFVDIPAGTSGTIYVQNFFDGCSVANNTCHTFSIECTSCAPPTPNAPTLSSVSDITASIAFSNATILEYGAPGFTPGADENAGQGTVIELTTSPQLITGLDPTTDYDVYVRNECNGNFSDNSDVLEFLTLAPPAEGEACTNPLEITSLPYTITDNTSNYGNNYSGTDRPSIAGAQYTDGTGGTGYLNGDDVVFSFTPNADGCFNFNLTNIDTWVGFWLFEGCPFTSVVAYHTATGSGERNLPFIDLQEGVTYYIVISTFPAPNSTSFTLTVENCPTCLDPSELSATNITDEGADLSWVNNSIGNQFDVEIVESGETPTETPTDVGVGNPFTATGLLPGTDYEFYVRADCGSGDFSNWIGPFSFTTLPALTCSDAPVNVTHCYGDNADDQFTYIALNTGDLPTLVINSGTTENNFDELIVYDGVTTSDPILYQASGDHSGVVVQSTTGTLLVRITSDGSVSCETGSACCAAGLDWDVFCAQPLIFGCTDATAVNFNPDATVDDGSCILPNCSEPPLNVTHCYDNNADDQFLYEGINPGDLPSIFVNSGTTEVDFDNLIIYDGPDTDAPVLYDESGNHSGTLVESTSGFLLVRITSDGSVSCEEGSACCVAGLDWNIFCGQEYVTPDLSNVSANNLSVCLNEDVSLLADGEVGEVQWFDDECGGNLIGTGTSISVTLTETTTFYARNINFNIPSENCLAVTVSVQPSLQANIVENPALEVCEGEEVELTVNTSFTSLLPELFTLWNFNDENFDPILGVGELVTIGDVGSSWATGNGSTDPAGTNRALNTNGYPSQGEDPKTAGIELAVNTAGFENVFMSFDVRASNTAANTLAIQYTLDVTEASPVWIDATSVVLTVGNTWTNENAVDFSSIMGASNNPNFGVRIVSDFDQTEGEYVAANLGSSYSTAGTLRFDMISFLGIPTTEPTPDILWSTLETTESIFVNQSDVYSVLVSAAGYCSDSAEVEVVVNPTIELTEDVAICDNDSIFLEGAFQNMTGTYVDTFSSVLTGCDSILTTNLTVHPTFETTLQDTICDNEFYLLPDGDSTNVADTYTFNLSTVNSCDSVVIIELEVLPSFTQTISETICEGDSFTLPNGVQVFDEDVYEVVFNAQNGCDSTILIDLEVLPLSTTTLQEQICEGDGFTLPNGTEVFDEDTYEVVFTGSNSCDSIVFVELSFYPDLSTSQQEAICEDESFTLPDGTDVSDAGTYEFTNPDVNGCDSTHTIVLEVNPLPEIELENEISAPSDSTVVLDAGAGFETYEWSTNENTQTIEVTFPNDEAYTVTVTDENQCSNTATTNVSFFIINSIKDMSLDGLKVYPVPASDKVNVQFTTSEKNIKMIVVDALGSKLLEQQFSNIQEQFSTDINVSSFAEGVYFIQFIGDQKSASTSFVVVK